MENKEQIADMLLKNGLAPTREHAIMLAEKFQAMDNNKENKVEYSETDVNISTNNNQLVSYEEDVMMKVSAPSFAEALLHSTPKQNIPKPEPQPQQRDRSIPGAHDQTEAQRRLHETKVDITEFFNVNNMKKK